MLVANDSSTGIDVSNERIRGKDPQGQTIGSRTTVVWPEAPTEVLARMVVSDQGRTLHLDAARPRLAFGRSAENEIVLGDEFASRDHGRIELKNGKFYLTDSSTNGTLIVRSHGFVYHVHEESVLLDGAGTLQLGRMDGAEFSFSVERSPDGREWVPETLAPLPAASALTDQDTFRLEGEYWTLAFGGRALRVKDSKGLRYIAHLLRQPEHDVLSVDLVQEYSEGSESTVKGVVSKRDMGPALDPAAKQAYKSRLAELKEMLAEGESNNDLGLSGRAAEEIAFIEQELSRAVGLYGRDRQSGSVMERARVTVTVRIKEALKKLDQFHPPLGRHLMNSIKTGRYCSYRPDSANPCNWGF